MELNEKWIENEFLEVVDYRLDNNQQFKNVTLGSGNCDWHLSLFPGNFLDYMIHDKLKKETLFKK